MQKYSQPAPKSFPAICTFPLCGIFYPNSVCVVRYDALIGGKSPTNCDGHFTESFWGRLPYKKQERYHYEKTAKLYGSPKGNLYSDRCSSHHCSRSLFLSGAKPYVSKQYLWSWNCSFQFCAIATVCDHHDFKCGSFDHWIFYLRKGIWGKNGIHQHCASTVYRTFRENISEF